MRTSTLYAALTALLAAGTFSAPLPAPVAVALPEIEAREPQVLSSLLGGGSSSQSDSSSSQSGNKAGNNKGNKGNGNTGNGELFRSRFGVLWC